MLATLVSELFPEPHSTSHAPVGQNEAPKQKQLSKCLCEVFGSQTSKCLFKKKIMLKLESRILLILRKHERPVVMPKVWAPTVVLRIVGLAVTPRCICCLCRHWQILKYLKNIYIYIAI